MALRFVRNVLCACARDRVPQERYQVQKNLLVDFVHTIQELLGVRGETYVSVATGAHIKQHTHPTARCVGLRVLNTVLKASCWDY